MNCNCCSSEHCIFKHIRFPTKVVPDVPCEHLNAGFMVHYLWLLLTTVCPCLVIQSLLTTSLIFQGTRLCIPFSQHMMLSTTREARVIFCENMFENQLVTTKIQHLHPPQKRKTHAPWMHAASPHWLQESFLPTCLLYDFWPRVMLGAWTTGLGFRVKAQKTNEHRFDVCLLHKLYHISTLRMSASVRLLISSFGSNFPPLSFCSDIQVFFLRGTHLGKERY
jgi:hypothetical protein